MTAHVSAWGRLGREPQEIATSNDKTMAVASIALDIADPRQDDPAPLWLGVVAFGKYAEALLKHDKGECISVSGRLQRRTYQDRSGETREQLQVVADAVVSARTVRPGGRKKSDQATQATRELYSEPDAAGGAPFDDPLPDF